MRSFLPFAIAIIAFRLFSQCPDFTGIQTNPNCNPDCELCKENILTINVEGSDLPATSVVKFYADEVSGFNPYRGEGTYLGSSIIKTNTSKCRICPSLLGFMIDACGSEAKNEFIVVWTGSGFNTADFNFDFAFTNNILGASNADIGTGACSIIPGNPSLVGGCSALSAGNNFKLPANSIWILFTSSSASTVYNFSALCGLSCKIYVSANSCDRTIGCFSNFDASPGIRTQIMNIAGCSCSTIAVYTIPGSLTGQGDFWAEGSIVNNGCNCPGLNPPDYFPANSFAEPFKIKIPVEWCNKTVELTGILDPTPDQLCCSEKFVPRIQIYTNCPVANTGSLEVCEIKNAQTEFQLEQADEQIRNGNSGSVSYYLDYSTMNQLHTPYHSGSAIIYAQVSDGACKSDPAAVELKVHLLPVAKSSSMDLCEESNNTAEFDLSSIESSIKNGITAEIRFFLDENKTLPVTPPLQSFSRIIYASISDEFCESKPVPVKLTVHNVPQGMDTLITFCPDSNGKAEFNLKALDSYFTKNNKDYKLSYYRDEILSKIISTDIYTLSDTFYTCISDDFCKSDPIAIFYHTALPTIPKTLHSTFCIHDSLISGAFLENIFQNYITSKDSINFQWYLDSLFLFECKLPFILLKTDTLYALLNASSCQSSCILILEPAMNNSAGTDQLVPVCSGSTINLRQIINAMDTTGNFYSANFSHAVLNTVYTIPDSVILDTIYYVLKFNGNCNPDTSLLLLKKIFESNPGSNATISICENAEINFNELYRNEDTGGIYHDLNKTGALINEIWSGHLSGPGNFDIVYQTDSKNGCPLREAIIHLTVLPFIQIDSISDVVSCEYFILPTITGVHANGNTRYNSDSLGNGVIYQSGDTIFNDQKIYVLANQDIFCKDERSFSIHISDADSTNYSINICLEDSIFIGTQFYNSGHQEGYEIFKKHGSHSCDSIVHVQLKLISPTDSLLRDTLCPESKIEINGTIYDIHHSKGIENIISKDSISCDKLIDIDLSFFSTSAFSYRSSRCLNDSVFINNSLFDKIHYKINDTLVGMSSHGCDSTRDILILFRGNDSTFFQPQICSRNSISINGNTYDKNKPTGKEIFQSALGCDSIVEISLIFKSAIETYNPIQLCASDSVLIQGNWLGIKKRQQSDTLFAQATGGCDSIVATEIIIYPENKTLIQKYLCLDEQLIIHGSIYDYSHTSGKEIFTSMLGCDSIVIIELQFPTFITEPIHEYHIYKGQYIQLNLNPAFSPTSIAWQKDTSLSCDNCLDPIAKPDSTTIYKVILTDDKACQLETEIKIIVNYNETIYLPNVFSPNGDGINDLFKPTGFDNSKIKTFRIYDRWGNLLHEESDKLLFELEGWNGSSNQRILNPAVYIYSIELEKPNSLIQNYRGNITLIR